MVSRKLPKPPPKEKLLLFAGFEALAYGAIFPITDAAEPLCP